PATGQGPGPSDEEGPSRDGEVLGRPGQTSVPQPPTPLSAAVDAPEHGRPGPRAPARAPRPARPDLSPKPPLHVDTTPSKGLSRRDGVVSARSQYMMVAK